MMKMCVDERSSEFKLNRYLRQEKHPVIIMAKVGFTVVKLPDCAK